jgi:hypothetical protein
MEANKSFQGELVKIIESLNVMKERMDIYMNEFKKITMRENLSLRMIEGIKDEQRNLKEQYMKLSDVLEVIKNKKSNINGQVEMMLALNNNKMVQILINSILYFMRLMLWTVNLVEYLIN